MREVLNGFSRAMYSNWLWHKPLQLVVDAGEGLQLGLGRHVVAPTHLLMTHGHSDHVLGLPGFIAARRFSLGAPDKPLTVIFPEGSPAIDLLHASLDRLWPSEKFPVTWIAAAPDAELPLAKNRFIRAFATRHPSRERALGFLVLESRRRLKPEFAACSESELRQRATSGGRAAMTEEYRHILFAHTGDTMPLAPDLFRRADLLVHDATFLQREDRRADLHATTSEAITVARDAGVRRLVLHHVSVRYDRGSLRSRLRAQVQELGFGGECWLLDDSDVIPLAGISSRHEASPL
ncbi:MAG: MBL fold metallo-hydrolase [Acidobacteria bacterium]|nr:MBL fold metallo-hydrolase [Acidobacteriota bacterium]